MDFSLAEILVGNLLLNSLKYAPVDGIIDFNFNENELVISNLAEHNALDETNCLNDFKARITR